MAERGMMRMLFRNKKGIEWDALIIWILLIAGIVLIITIIALMKGKGDTILHRITDIFRFGA